MKRALYSKLEIWLVGDDVIRWRCGQLLSRDFMVYKMKPSGRASDFGYTLEILELWVIVSL